MGIRDAMSEILSRTKRSSADAVRAEEALPEGFRDTQVEQASKQMQADLWENYHPEWTGTGKIERNVTPDDVQARESAKGEQGVQGHMDALAAIAFKVANGEVNLRNSQLQDEIHDHVAAILTNLNLDSKSGFVDIIQDSFNQRVTEIGSALSGLPPQARVVGS